MKHWQGDVASPDVSICCATYNHEEFIEKAVDSFLMQATDFPFEILIHDDASSDQTTNLVRRYAEAYPAIVRIRIQGENQYSKTPIIVPKFLFPMARGRYIALCEGDDFWRSAEKLAVQCAAMDRNPQVNLSFHPAIRLDESGESSKLLAQSAKSEVLVDTSRIILGGGGYCPTPSIVLRSSIAPLITECVLDAPVGDKFIQIIASFGHGALFLPEAMAVYRAGLPGSWNQRINDSVVLRQYEQRIRFPYKWLYKNCDANLVPLLQFSEADQYLSIGKKYCAVRDFESASRVVKKSSSLFTRRPTIRRFIVWIANGSLRTRIFLAIYPGLRSIYRHISLSKGQKRS